jgi:hypothetical protein
MFDIDDLLHSGLGGVWRNFIDTGGGGDSGSDDAGSGSAGSDASDTDDPYYQAKTDGPYAGWSNYALDNLKGSLSPTDFGAFLQDRIGTFGANNMNQDPDAPPAQPTLRYDPTDYGAPAISQPEDSGQAGGSDQAAASGSSPGGWFTNQGIYQNQAPPLGAGSSGQTGGWASPYANLPDKGTAGRVRTIRWAAMAERAWAARRNTPIPAQSGCRSIGMRGRRLPTRLPKFKISTTRLAHQKWDNRNL